MKLKKNAVMMTGTIALVVGYAMSAARANEPGSEAAKTTNPQKEPFIQVREVISSTPDSALAQECAT